MISLIAFTRARHPCRHRRTAALVLLLTLGPLLLACTPGGPEDALQDYLARLARTLDQDAPLVAPAQWPRIPDTRELKLVLEDNKLDALDFLSLSGCAVQVTIGKRNSSLGRLAPPSQRLLLDLEYLALAPACVESLAAEGEKVLADTLQQAWELKREQLPARIYLATLGSPEYRALWRKPSSLADYPGNTASTVVTALAAIDSLAARWLAGDYRADNMEFEIFLGEVATGDGGALMEALATQNAWLNAANDILQRRFAEGPLCSASQRHPQSEILRTVVHKFFIAGVQPWSAAVSRRHYELLVPLQALEARLAEALPPTYRDWRQSRDTFLEHTNAAPRTHVGQIQQLLDPCLDPAAAG